LAAQGPDATNNLAEYVALIAGLQALIDMGLAGHVEVRGDSQLVIRQMTGEYQVGSARLRPLHRRAVNLVRRVGSVTWRWVSHKQNDEAERLSRAAYIEAQCTGLLPDAGRGAPPAELVGSITRKNHMFARLCDLEQRVHQARQLGTVPTMLLVERDAAATDYAEALDVVGALMARRRRSGDTLPGMPSMATGLDKPIPRSR
jgi:hypothetical protein